MTPPRSYRVVTLGCKLNQFDSASVEGELRARGFLAAAENTEAGVVVVNTCTVTENADREARRAVRRARRENPGCRIIVTGCYAERDRGRIESMEEVDAVVGRSDRPRLPDLLETFARTTEPIGDIACIEEAGRTAAPWFGERTRAFLKIQEGCDLRCSYCIIPKVRGRSLSVPPDAVRLELQRLIDRGFQEIVLTGVNTGDYGRDLVPRTELATLLRGLLDLPGLGRIRLNSLEPRTVTPGVVSLLSEGPRLARHLQVPLQSGSDRILRRMRRNYGSGDYLRTIERLRTEVPGIGLGADVIVGFPGETDLDFGQTCRLIEASPLNYLHVFSYSDRPGTPASVLADHVAPEVVRERSARLRAIGARLGLEFRRSFLGRSLPTLVLSERRPDGRFRGLTDNFIDLGVEAGDREVNSIVQATLVVADERETLAVLPRAASPPPGMELRSRPHA